MFKTNAQNHRNRKRKYKWDPRNASCFVLPISVLDESCAVNICSYEIVNENMLYVNYLNKKRNILKKNVYHCHL